MQLSHAQQCEIHISYKSSNQWVSVGAIAQQMAISLQLLLFRESVDISENDHLLLFQETHTETHWSKLALAHAYT
jgi:hypothetical protein